MSKMLALCSAIDLKIKGGCTPFYWSLFAALNRIGVDVTVMPFSGKTVQSLWWTAQDNPVRTNSLIGLLSKPYSLLNKTKISSNPSLKETPAYVRSTPNLKQVIVNCQERKWGKLWLKSIENTLTKEKYDFIVMFCPPVHIIAPYVSYLRNKYNLPILLYEADFPTYLFNSELFKTSWYATIDLSVFDGVIVNSEGVLPKLGELGVKNSFAFDFGADASALSYPSQQKDIDVSFYGYGSFKREDAIKTMITLPSKKLRNRKFVVAGPFQIDLGCVTRLKGLNNMEMKRLCYRSKINLNITRSTFAETTSSSTARLFELAMMGACIVSNPYSGIEKWFKPNDEVLIVHDVEEALETYATLLSDDAFCANIGKKARERALRDHTYDNRALEFQEIICKVLY